MTRRQTALLALGVLVLSPGHAAAQITIEPVSPRWGESIKYEIVPDSETTAKSFGVDTYPKHMVLDRAGQIVWLSGSDDERIERLRAMIVRVLASEGK